MRTEAGSTSAGGPSGWRLRPARSTDLGWITAILAVDGLPADGIAGNLPTWYVAAETEAGVPVGVAGLEVWESVGLIRSVIVAPEVRGRGIGVALMRDRLAWARHQGLTEVYLLTISADAERFWERQGFRRLARAGLPASLHASAELRGACPDTAVTMMLRLSPTS